MRDPDSRGCVGTLWVVLLVGFVVYVLLRLAILASAALGLWRDRP